MFEGVSKLGRRSLAFALVSVAVVVANQTVASGILRQSRQDNLCILSPRQGPLRNSARKRYRFLA